MTLAKGLGLAALALCAANAQAAETVVIRTATGQFVRVADDGNLRADHAYPTPACQFALDPLSGGRLTLKATNGRFLVASDLPGRVLRADSPRAEPSERETLHLVAVEGNRVGLKVAGFREFIAFDPAAMGDAPKPDLPRPSETIEIFRTGDVPATVQGLLAVVIRGVMQDEIGEKQYEQTRTRKIEKWVELPAPTIKDLGRKRRHRMLATEERTQVRARLDGEPQFALAEMPYLKGYTQSGSGLLMFVVSATVPFRGDVHYKMPDVISAGTGYQATANLFLVGEMRVEKSGDSFAFSPAEVKQLNIQLQLRDISNDLMNLGRAPIEREINTELRHNDARIRQQANKAIAKALGAQQFQHPLLKYLMLP
jgi:hypothetical protein